jgi:hypothetical protein
MPNPADIVPLLAKHLDPHLAIKVLQFLREGGHRNGEQVLAAEMRILEKTNLVDLMAELAHKNKDSPTSGDIQKRRKVAYEELQRLTVVCCPLLDVLVNEKKVQQMQEEKSLTSVELRDKHNVPSEAIENLYRYSSFSVTHCVFPLPYNLLQVLQVSLRVWSVFRRPSLLAVRTSSWRHHSSRR